MLLNNVNVPFKTLRGEDFTDGATIAKGLANIFISKSDKDPAKWVSMATRLYEDGEVEISLEDLKSVVEVVKSATMSNLEKHQIINTIETAISNEDNK